MKHIYTTYYDDVNDNRSYEDYCDYCKDNYIEPSNENSQEYLDWVSSQKETDWNDFMDNISYSDYNSYPWIVTGKLGLWNKIPEIEPMNFDDLEEAIKEITEVSFDYKLIIEHIEDHLEITQIHHDGRNHFELYCLNKKGERAGKESDLTKECYRRKLTEYLF